MGRPGAAGLRRQLSRGMVSSMQERDSPVQICPVAAGGGAWGMGSADVTSSRPAAAQHLSDLARLRGVRDRIDREYAQPLYVEVLARGAHMSAGHFSREFRRA